MSAIGDYVLSKHLDLGPEAGSAENYALNLKRKVYFLLENKHLKDLGYMTRFKGARDLSDFCSPSYYRIVSNMVKPFLESAFFDKTFFRSNQQLSKVGNSSIKFSAGIEGIRFYDHYDSYRRLAQIVNNINRDFPLMPIDTYDLYRRNQIQVTFNYDNIGLINGSLFISEATSTFPAFLTALNEAFRQAFPNFTIPEGTLLAPQQPRVVLQETTTATIPIRMTPVTQYVQQPITDVRNPTTIQDLRDLVAATARNE